MNLQMAGTSVSEGLHLGNALGQARRPDHFLQRTMSPLAASHSTGTDRSPCRWTMARMALSMVSRSWATRCPKNSASF